MTTHSRILSELLLISFSLACCFQFRTAHALSCTACILDECVEPTCAGNTTLDPCQCCRACAKQEDEQCGGIYDLLGTCDVGLSCVTEAINGDEVSNPMKIGTCKPTTSVKKDCVKSMFFGCNLVDGSCACGAKFSCSNPYQFASRHLCEMLVATAETSEDQCQSILCDVQPSPQCPEDSLLVEGHVPPGGCCPSPSRCECQFDLCDINLCAPGSSKNIRSFATRRPGTCCDVYDCVPRYKDMDECAAVRCHNLPLDLITCPSDSVSVRGPPSTCCLGIPECRCNESFCEPPTCSLGSVPRISTKGNGNPGSCCDVYTCAPPLSNAGCLVDGNFYEEGDYYYPACQVCRCRNGIGLCKRRDCPRLTCDNVIRIPGSCCPHCVQAAPEGPVPSLQPFCNDGGHTYAVGESWTMADECTFCMCASGGKIRCKAAYCRGPQVVSTSSPCPDIRGCLLDDVVCPGGRERDDNDCPLCSCNAALPDTTSCPSMDDCTLSCSRGYQTDERGCTKCKCKQRKCKQLSLCQKQCPYGYRKNKKKCHRCKCRHCPPLDACKKKCSDGLATNKFGCQVCRCKVPRDAMTVISIPKKVCYDTILGRSYDDGETWSSNCYICVCRGGQVMCDLLKCPLPLCEYPRWEPESCCATCPGESLHPPFIPPSLACLQYEYDWLVEGDTWDVNPCLSCTCHSGFMMCSSKQCPPVACEDPFFDETSCCPKCLEPSSAVTCEREKFCIDTDGSLYESGSTFQPDPCTSCTCKRGTIECFNETCSSQSYCSYPVVRRGECCPVCLDREPVPLKPCSVDGASRMHGQEWNETSPVCKTCVCADGRAVCEECCVRTPSRPDKVVLLTEAPCQDCGVSGEAVKTTAAGISTTIPVKAVHSEIPSTNKAGLSSQILIIIAVSSAVFLLFIICMGIAIKFNFICRKRKQRYDVKLLEEQSKSCLRS